LGVGHREACGDQGHLRGRSRPKTGQNLGENGGKMVGKWWEGKNSRTCWKNGGKLSKIVEN